MTQSLRIAFGVSVLALCAGCTPGTNLPLLFAQATTVGITINAGATSQTPELTLGYRDVDAALIPTTYTQLNGTVAPLMATIGNQAPGTCDSFNDSLSVLGQFQVNASAGASASSNPPATPPAAAQVGLGKFFATGQAAKRLSDGFAHQLQNSNAPSPPPQPPTPPTGASPADCFRVVPISLR